LESIQPDETAEPPSDSTMNWPASASNHWIAPVEHTKLNSPLLPQSERLLPRLEMEKAFVR